MVEYKKKKLILQSGGTRNYYYKVNSDGKKKQVSKNEYLEKKGGTVKNNANNWEAPPMITMNNFNKNEKNKLNKIHFGTEESNKFLRNYRWNRNNDIQYLFETKKRLLKEKEESIPKFFKDLNTKTDDFTSKNGMLIKGPLFNSIKEDLMKILNGQVEMYKYWNNLMHYKYANESTLNSNKKQRIIPYSHQHFTNTHSNFTWEDAFTHKFISATKF